MGSYTVALYLFFTLKKLFFLLVLSVIGYIGLKFLHVVSSVIEEGRDVAFEDMFDALKKPLLALFTLLGVLSFIPKNHEMITLVTVEAVQRAATTEEAKELRQFVLKELKIRLDEE